MSWDAYVSNNLMMAVDTNGSTLSSAALLGLDGSVWAQSPEFPAFEGDEFNKMIQSFTDASITSLTVAGVKYMKINSDETVLRCRKDKIGFIARKTATAIVMGCYQDPPVSGQTCNKVVEALGEYLEQQGY